MHFHDNFRLLILVYEKIASPGFIPGSASYLTHISFKERDSMKFVMKE
jgi:hypothetical protein